MKQVRAIAALPVAALGLIVAIFALVFFQWLPNLLRRAHYGSAIHVFVPISHLKRAIQGVEQWQPEDCLLFGIQPTNARDIARARAYDKLSMVVCDCGKPDCQFKNPVFIPRSRT